MERLNRPKEVSNILNPALCGLLLWVSIRKYSDVLAQPMPISYIYLVLPLVLHKATRRSLPHSSTTSLLAWVKDNPDLEMGFAVRAANMTRFANEALMFLAKFGYIAVRKETAGIAITKNFSTAKLRAYLASDEEIDECVKKASVVGSVLARCSSPSSAYTALGVTP